MWEEKTRNRQIKFTLKQKYPTKFKKPYQKKKKSSIFKLQCHFFPLKLNFILFPCFCFFPHFIKIATTTKTGEKWTWANWQCALKYYRSQFYEYWISFFEKKKKNWKTRKNSGKKMFGCFSSDIQLKVALRLRIKHNINHPYSLIKLTLEAMRVYICVCAKRMKRKWNSTCNFRDTERPFSLNITKFQCQTHKT